MAKASKKSKEPVPPASAPAEPVATSQTGNGAAKTPASTPLKATVAKPAKSKVVAKPRAVTARKSSTARKSRGVAPRTKAAAGEISDEEIRIRAYFISQERMREGRPGNSADDWLEARRQLEAQARKRA
jgi:Protein of unknown function (DUF2934)